MNLNYIAGFFDGEGSFVLRIRPDSRYKTGYQISTWINITQKNREILEIIQKELNMGKLYFHKRDKIWYYNIEKLQDKIKFIETFQNLLVVKRDSLKRFSDCLKTIKEKEHLTPEGLKKLKMIWSTPETEANIL
jgi:intein-encoded DNA endonuclease-like protein